MVDCAMVDPQRLRAAYEKAKADLLAERTPDGHWIGELSSSALSTATAVSALAMVRAVGWDKAAAAAGPPSVAPVGLRSQNELVPPYDALIQRGVAYLVAHQNPDGGFGDTDLSHSNIATTYLVVAALHLAGMADQHAALLERADAYLESKGRLDGLRKRYGIDKTFVVPIMTNLALAGLVDWKEIDALPFELACVPQSWYRFVGMPVVSYAIPALVAIGQARFFHVPPRNPITRLIRWLSITRSLQVLRRMQPDSGGYLEATPLTSFVVMSLASINSQASGRRKPPGNVDRSGDSPGGSRLPLASKVIRPGVQFLTNSIRPDGSWPIDTNLATWNTTLAINALDSADENLPELLSFGDLCFDKSCPWIAAQESPPRSIPTGNVLDWLIACQHTAPHPFTGADPGGFGWTNLSGAVPDADDTSGAILALHAVNGAGVSDEKGERIRVVRRHALGWLWRLQNKDGGIPTFCRGWGRLPFDRSGTDLTAHALRALGPRLDLPPLSKRALEFLRRSQHSTGSWSPLWFGNQDHPEEDNPVYGTAKVLMAYRDLGLMDSPEAQRGVAWLVGNQNADGGWGSGVWGRAEELQNAKCKLQIANCEMQGEEPAPNAELGARSGVESGESVTGVATGGHSVLSTQYSVPGTGQEIAMPAQSAIRNPQSAMAAPPICNLQFAITNLQSSVEETALAVEALLAACPRNATEGVPYSAVSRGLAWLIDRVEQNEHRQPAPIGFYFAKLWYYERLYPLTFTVAALGRACRQFAHPVQLDSHADPASARAP